MLVCNKCKQPITMDANCSGDNMTCTCPRPPVVNPELSQPDSEGWWWFKGTCGGGVFGVQPLPFLMIELNGKIVTNDDYWNINDFKGTWVKAIVPEFKEE